MLTIGSLFAGIGGLELGLEWAGLGPVVWQVEADPWCRSVLKAHWPEAERHDDVRDVGADQLAPVDLICGGFPCQDVSGAGKGAGLHGSRSGLWWQFARLVGELAPSWVVVENVAKTRGPHWIDPVRAELEKLGYASLPIPLAAADVGAPHQRDRLFVVAARDAPYAYGDHLRDERKRRPRRRSRKLRAQGNAEPQHDGDAENAADDGRERRGHRGMGDVGDGTKRARGSAGGRDDVPDCDSWGRESERLAVRRREQGARWHEPHRCDGEGIESRGCPGVWAPVPPVRGVDDGPASDLDKARLRSLGNAVVPQCGQVVGWVVRELAGLTPACVAFAQTRRSGSIPPAGAPSSDRVVGFRHASDEHPPA